MRARWGRRFGVAAATLVLASGCANATRGHLERGVFQAAEGFRVTVPGPQWEVAANGKAELELRHRVTAAGILANAECDAGITTRDLDVLTRRLFVGMRARRTIENGAATVAGVPAAHAVMETQAGPEADRLRVEAYVMKDERCVYDLVYVAPREAFDASRGDFQRFVDSFARTAR